MIHAVFFQLQTIDSFLENLAQDIEGRIEIDYVEAHGTAFDGWDQREILIQLVRSGLAGAVCFPSKGLPAPPIDVLHKKAVVLAPGSFEHLDATHSAIHEDMLASGVQQLREELDQSELVPIGFFCFSATPLMQNDPPPKTSDLLERIDALRARGGDVLLFHERELYCMTDLVNRYTKESVRFVVGLSLLVRVWEYRYTKLAGSFLEALSRLFARNVRIYAYPMSARDLEQSIHDVAAIGWTWEETDGWVSAPQLHPATPMNHLYDYALACNFLVPMQIPVAAAGKG